MGIKEIRHAIMQELQNQLNGIKTWWTGYPFYIETRHTPFVAVFSESETDEWRGQRSYKATYQLSIIVGINATGEIESRNRGIENEDWLNDMGTQIVAILFSKLYRIGNATLLGNIDLDYRNGGGNIRTLTISFSYTENVIFNI